ncbi:hypothetical protein ABZ746_37455 [Streptomyces sp. NPDC020096]
MYTITSGYISPYFVNTPERATTEFDDAYVLLVDKTISVVQPLLPILEAVVRSGRSLLIVARDVDGEALTTLVLNKLRGGLKVCAVKVPGPDFSDTLAALAQATGSYVVSDDALEKPEELDLDDLGTDKPHVVVTKDRAFLSESKIPEEDIPHLIPTSEATPGGILLPSGPFLDDSAQ